MTEGFADLGRWYVDPKDPGRVRREGQGLVAIVVTRADIGAPNDREKQYERERAAIARLIAAAPEMLEALRACEGAFAGPGGMPPGGREALEAVRRVLARLKGP